MKRRNLDYSTGFALLLEAALDKNGGEKARSVENLEGAIRSFEKANMKLYREVARFCLAHLQPHETGLANRKLAESWMKAEGVVDPQKMAAALAPGLF